MRISDWSSDVCSSDLTRLQDVDAVDLLDARHADADARAPQQLVVQTRTGDLVQLLGIVDPVGNAIRIKPHRRRHHRPRQWPAPSLVNPDHLPVIAKLDRKSTRLNSSH